jgi:hypothetical protein
MMMISLYSQAGPHERSEGILFVRAPTRSSEPHALLYVVKRARRIESTSPRRCEVRVEGSSLELDTYRMPYSWRENVWSCDHAADVIQFLKMQAALCGPHKCRCGHGVRLTTEYDFSDEASGYQWGFGVCARCNRSHLAFGDPAHDEIVKEKILEHSHLLPPDRFAALQFTYGVGVKGARFVLGTPPLRS